MINKCLKFIEKSSKIRFPKGKFIYLREVPKENEIVKHFLRNSFPCSIKSFTFNDFTSLSTIDFYLSGIKESIGRVSEKCIISNFEITDDQLISLFLSGYKVTTLGIHQCKIMTDSVPEFFKHIKTPPWWMELEFYY